MKKKKMLKVTINQISESNSICNAEYYRTGNRYILYLTFKI